MEFVGCEDEEARSPPSFSSWVVHNHDKSKYDCVEWSGYLNWFYPDEKHPQDRKQFDLAWLHHQHVNPHHWQYWILHKDSGEVVLMDMPEIYVIEMLCDWHSFSYKNEESTAWNWWENNQEKMLMSDKTKELVEKYIWLFKNEEISNKETFVKKVSYTCRNCNMCGNRITISDAHTDICNTCLAAIRMGG